MVQPTDRDPLILASSFSPMDRPCGVGSLRESKEPPIKTLHPSFGSRSRNRAIRDRDRERDRECLKPLLFTRPRTVDGFVHLDRRSPTNESMGALTFSVGQIVDDPPILRAQWIHHVAVRIATPPGTPIQHPLHSGNPYPHNCLIGHRLCVLNTSTIPVFHPRSYHA